jgi:hypothetical protein
MVMKLRTNAPEWTGNGNPDKVAKCLDFPPSRTHDPFFGDGPDAFEEDARDLCNGVNDGVVCPIRHDCLIFALINNEHYGVWGGLQAHDRAAIRRFTPREDWAWREPTHPDEGLLQLLREEHMLAQEQDESLDLSSLLVA